MLTKEVTAKTLELRHLKGEELQGFGMENLMKLNKLIEAGLSRVSKTKGGKFMKEIGILQKKEALLKEENARLKHKVVNTSETQTPVLEQGIHLSLSQTEAAKPQVILRISTVLTHFSSWLENRKHAMLTKEVTRKTLELRHLKGEELQGLDMENLIKLEKLIETGLRRVSKIKDDKFMKEIGILKKKEALLKEENARLKQKVCDVESTSETQTPVLEQGNSSESITNLSCQAPSHPQDLNSSDTFLKLGLPFPN